MTAIGFQLWSLHDVPDPLPHVLDRVGESGFEGVEFAGLDDTAENEIRRALDRNGLETAGMHVAIDEIEAAPGDVAETCRTFDCKHVVVPWLDHANFEDREAIEATASRLDTLADTVADHGLTLHYHNHDQEFATVDHRPALSHLVDATNAVRFQLDLGWVGAAGYAPLPFLESIGDRVDLVHLKDYDVDIHEPVPVGTGHLDVPATVDLVDESGVDWLIYEAETAPDDYGTLTGAAERLAPYW